MGATFKYWWPRVNWKLQGKQILTTSKFSNNKNFIITRGRENSKKRLNTFSHQKYLNRCWEPLTGLLLERHAAFEDIWSRWEILNLRFMGGLHEVFESLEITCSIVCVYTYSLLLPREMGHIFLQILKAILQNLWTNKWNAFQFCNSIV